MSKIQTLDTPQAIVKTHQIARFATSTVSRCKLQALKKDTRRVLHAWHMDYTTVSMTTDADHSHESLPRRSVLIAEKCSDSNVAHSLVQAEPGSDEKRIVYQNKRYAWKDKKKSWDELAASSRRHDPVLSASTTYSNKKSVTVLGPHRTIGTKKILCNTS